MTPAEWTAYQAHALGNLARPAGLPIAHALEPATRPSPWLLWGFLWRFGLGVWYAAGLWLMVADPLWLPTWVSATSIVGAWWAVWRGLVALLESR